MELTELPVRRDLKDRLAASVCGLGMQFDSGSSRYESLNNYLRIDSKTVLNRWYSFATEGAVSKGSATNVTITLACGNHTTATVQIRDLTEVDTSKTGTYIS